MNARTIVLAAALVAAALDQCLLAEPPLSPCEAFGAADAVFIGEAGARVRLSVRQPDGSGAPLTFSPVTVERVYRGAPNPTMFVTPAGIETYLRPGERYLVYGRAYAAPNMVMSAESYGTKLLSDATHDLEFLDVISANATGAAISGVLELDVSDVAHIGTQVSPLANVRIRLSGDPADIELITASDGQFFATGLRGGTYTTAAVLPGDLVLTNNPSRTTRVLAGGCAPLRLQAIPNGHIRGIVSSSDERITFPQQVELIPVDVTTGGHDAYVQSVAVDAIGRFAFDGVRPGRYLLARLPFHLDGVPIPSVYYPGTTDRAAATIIIVGSAGTQDVGEFHIPRAE